MRCPIESTVTFDGSSDDLKSRRGDLKSSMRTRDLFWSHWGSIGGGLGVPGCQGEHLGDPMEPLGWFDESSDDSWGI